MSIKDRLEVYRNHLGIKKQEDFCEPLGVPTNTYKRLTNPNYETLMKFLEAYPNMSAEWLMRGEGKMLREEIPFSAPKEEIKTEPRKFTYLDLFAGIGGMEMKEDFQTQLLDLKLGSYIRRMLDAQGQDEHIHVLNDRIEKLEKLLEQQNKNQA